MSDDSIAMKSPLHFDSFKIDSLNLKMKPEFDLLKTQGDIEGYTWSYNINIRPPLFFKATSEYVGGLLFGMALFEDGLADKKSENALIDLSVSIAGVFKVTEKLSEETEQRLIKVNIPVILMPHIRATVVSFFACAGYGSVPVPVINIAKLAQEKFTNSEVQIIE